MRTPSPEVWVGSTVLTDRPSRAAFYLPLIGICLLALGLRAPGLQWLLGATPYAGFDFHPDVMNLIRPTENFSTIKTWRGYPLGMTTQLYLLRGALEGMGLYFDPVLLIRAISLTYGVLTVFLAGVVGRALSASSGVGLLTALFLALAPMHIINSHFGTADSALVFFLYVSFVFGWRSLRGGGERDFVLFIASVGVTLAIKFFIPLLLPLAIVVWHQERRLERAFQAALLLAGSFSVMSFFNYTPWDLNELFGMIREDNLTTAASRTPLRQLVLYVWATPRALGLGIWLFFVGGLAVALARGWRLRPKGIVRDPAAWYGLTRSPLIVPASALALHFASLLSADFHAPRHLLPFLPVMCFLAATGFAAAASKTASKRTAAGAVLVLLVAYQTYNAVGVEAAYANDIRNALAVRVSEVASPGDDVLSFTQYSQVRGARLPSVSEDADSLIDADYFVACDIEYNRYFSADDASEVFHAYGGQRRLDFYRDLFADRLEYRLVYEVTREDFTLEQRLVSRGILRDIGPFTMGRCVLYAHT